MSSSQNNDGTFKTLLVATSLCIVCSILVSGAAVKLKSRQEKNKKLDIQKNILTTAGLLPAGTLTEDRVTQAFEKIETRLVNLAQGTMSANPSFVDHIDQYNAKKALQDNHFVHLIPKDKDLAKIKMRATWKKVYLVKDDSGQIKTLVLPVRGKGLWSTLYGFVALEKDAQTVVGLSFYKHGETPGLGGEIDNPAWRASWKGKRIVSEDGTPFLQVLKGAVATDNPQSFRQIDGLSGATITSVGVEHLINYWLGEDGFGPFLQAFRNGDHDEH